MASANGDARHDLAYSQSVRESLRVFATADKAQGLAGPFREALLHVDHLLHHRPLEFGEALCWCTGSMQCSISTNEGSPRSILGARPAKYLPQV